MESCLSCELQQSQILHRTEQAMGQEGEQVFPVLLYYPGIFRVLNFHLNTALSKGQGAFQKYRI